MPRRVIAYIDGFNLYNGLKAKHQRKYLWLDLQKLVLGLVQEDQVFERVRYFTAAVRNNEEAAHRQKTWLDAQRVQNPLYVSIDLGRFQEKRVRCRNCKRVHETYEEKETDVRIALALAEDAFDGAFETALLISGDSDLVPAVELVKRVNPAARVVAVFPPRRKSEDLARVAHASFMLSDSVIRRSLLPDQLTSRTGLVHARPRKWR